MLYIEISSFRLFLIDLIVLEILMLIKNIFSIKYSKFTTEIEQNKKMNFRDSTTTREDN